jgi:hypothetical protein
MRILPMGGTAASGLVWAAQEDSRVCRDWRKEEEWFGRGCYVRGTAGEGHAPMPLRQRRAAEPAKREEDRETQ